MQQILLKSFKASRICLYSAILLWILHSSTTWASSSQILSPLPSGVNETWSNLEFVGQTSLRKFGFHIYDSSFWIIDKQNDDNEICSSTCALSITYARKIRAHKLLSNTKKEWLRFVFLSLD